MSKMTRKIGVWTVEFSRPDGSSGLVTIASAASPTAGQIASAICDLDDGYHYLVADIFSGIADEMVGRAFLVGNGLVVERIESLEVESESANRQF